MHRTLRKVLVSSDRRLIQPETHRGLRDSGQDPPGNKSSGGGHPPKEGGTKVGHREDKIVIKDRLLQAHRRAQERGGNASRKAGGGGAGPRMQDREGQGDSTDVQGAGVEKGGNQGSERECGLKSHKGKDKKKKSNI